MIDTTFAQNRHGELVLRIELTGTTDIFRFAVNMLGHQIEFGAAGRAALVELRERVGAETFDPWALSMLGADRYAKLRDRFERDTYCVSCQRDLAPDEYRRPLPNAEILGACCDPKAPKPPPACPSEGAYRRHLAAGEPVDPACREHMRGLSRRWAGRQCRRGTR